MEEWALMLKSIYDQSWEINHMLMRRRNKIHDCSHIRLVDLTHLIYASSYELNDQRNLLQPFQTVQDEKDDNCVADD